VYEIALVTPGSFQCGYVLISHSEAHSAFSNIISVERE